MELFANASCKSEWINYLREIFKITPKLIDHPKPIRHNHLRVLDLGQKAYSKKAGYSELDEPILKTSIRTSISYYSMLGKSNPARSVTYSPMPEYFGAFKLVQLLGAGLTYKN